MTSKTTRELPSRKNSEQPVEPDLRRYLLDQGKSKISSKEIAVYLDSMKKNEKRVEIKAVNAEDTLLREQVTALAHQFANLPQLLEDSLGSSLKSMID
jgi:hypothetical protein